MLCGQLYWLILGAFLFGKLRQVKGPQSSNSTSSEKKPEPNLPSNWWLQSRLLFMNDRDIAKWAFELMGENKNADAIACYTKAIEKNPNESFYYRQRGKCYLRLKYLEKAISDFAKSIHVDPQGDVYYFRSAVAEFGKFNDVIKDALVLLNTEEMCHIGDEMLKREKFEEALFCYDEAIKKNSSDVRIYKRRGMCYMKMNELELAVSDYREALKINPEDRVIVLHFRETLLDLDVEFDEAIRETLLILNANKLIHFGKEFCSRKKFEKALFCYNEAINKDPSSSKNYVERGICYMQMGNLEMALRDYNEAVRMGTQRSYCIPHFKKAVLKFGRLDGIVAETLRHFNVSELVSLGQDFCNVKKYVLALYCYNEATEKDPHGAKIYLERGHCYMQMEDREMALRDYSRAVQISPHRTDYVYFFKEVAFEFGKLNRDVERTLPVLSDETVVEFGEKFFNQNQFEEALFCYNLAIEKNYSAIYYRQRAKCHLHKKNFKMAISDYRRAAQIEPTEPSEQIDFCEILVKIGEYRTAIGLLKNLEIERIGMYHMRKLRKIREQAQKKEIEQLRNLITYSKKLIVENTDREIRKLEAGNNAGIVDEEVPGKISALKLKRDENMEQLNSALIEYEEMYANIGNPSKESESTETFNVKDIPLFDAPDYLCDKITLNLMVEPLVTPSTGISYEKEPLLSHLRNSGLDPVSRKPLSEDMLIPNKALKEAIRDWKDENKPWEEIDINDFHIDTV